MRAPLLVTLQRELSKTAPHRLVAVIWLGLLLGFFIYAATVGGIVLDGQGRPIPGDFFVSWAAGKSALTGHTAEVYNYPLFHDAQAKLIGHSFLERTPWPYPPLFFLIVSLLALIPYSISYLCWVAGTLAGYLISAKAIFRDWKPAITFGGSPAALLCCVVGQNGLFTASLFGAFLVTLEKRPLLSGLILAALAYKPQFGILIPVALLAGGYWRTVLAAIGGTLVWVAIWLLIDPAIFPSFFQALGASSQNYLGAGVVSWSKMQSLYGLLRLIGMTVLPAGVIQGAITLGAAAAVWLAWRSSLSFPSKAAILVIATLAATPYSFLYDFPLMTVGTGFLFRDRPFDRFELSLIGAAYALMAVASLIMFPAGPFELMLLSAIIVRRAFPERVIIPT